MIKKGVALHEALKSFGARKITAIILSTLFFVGLIIGYSVYMNSSEKKNIMLRGELGAVQSMEMFNRYIALGTSTVKASSYKIQNILDEGGGGDEILATLTEDTGVLKAAVDDRFTGLYAYVDGIYYDGAGWVPDDDYEPTERPWYKKAIANNGELTIIEPYVDAQTGEVSTTVVQSLKDKKDVVAIDISFDMVQMLNGGDSAPMDGSVRFIMDRNGSVLVHTDESQIGRNYMSEEGSLGATVARSLFKEDEACFDVDYDGSTYVVYSVRINDDWYSVSVIDSNSSYRPLRIMLILTVIVILITLIILSILYVSIIFRNYSMEKINTRLSATVDIYLAVVDIDLVNNVSTYIRQHKLVSESMGKRKVSDVQEGLYRAVEYSTYDDYKDKLREFADLSTLQERLNGSNTITMEFHSFTGKWCRARFIVAQYTRDGGLAHVLWMVENIDDEKTRRDELEEKSQVAIAASEAKSEFLSNMSHEIRTPINAILGMNEMILRESTDESIVTYAERIQNAGGTLLGLVNEILDISKIEAGRMEIVPDEYELSSVLNDMVNLVTPRIEEHDLLLELNFDKNVPNRLYGDEVRIRQIMTNILTNAAKYTKEGTVTFIIGYEKDGKDKDAILLNVAVKDTGIGIREEDIEDLFSEYARFDKKRNRNIEGTGLGMPITQKILNLMGSKLEVESEYGKGSVFSFSLKQKVIKWDPIGDYEASYKKNKAQRKKYKAKFTAPEVNVLVIDDTRMNLVVFKGLLKQTQVKIDTAGSGDEGIAAARKKKYDIIFLDHMMPRKDGIETLKELKAIEDYPSKDAPVICLTANAISGAREKYLQYGFDDYLTKPINSSKLEDMLIEYLPADKVIRNETEEE